MSRLWLTALVALSACDAGAEPVEGPAETAPCDDCATLDDVDELRAEIDELRAQLPVVVTGACNPDPDPTFWQTMEPVTVLSVRTCRAATDTYDVCWLGEEGTNGVFLANDPEAEGFAVSVTLNCYGYETYQITYLPG